jgi:hypothetical protein
MDWERYKARCDEPGVWSRWMLNQTLELLDDPHAPDLAPLQQALLQALQTAPLPKPDGHKGDDRTDMFELKLEAAEIARILEHVRRARAAGRSTSGTSGRGLGGFEEAWAEYLASRRS